MAWTYYGLFGVVCLILLRELSPAYLSLRSVYFRFSSEENRFDGFCCGVEFGGDSS